MERFLPWFMLKSVPGIGNHIFKRLIEHFGSPESVLDATIEELQQVEGLNAHLAGKVKHHRLPESVARDIDIVRRKKVRIIPMTDPEYPPLLHQIPDPPPFLYAKGYLEAEARPIAVVGSRGATRYGLATAQKLSFDLASLGITVVSGMARGIDTAAHEGALRAGKRTVAVLGSGLDRIYPAENRRLFQRICDSGAVLSEFPMTTEPDAFNFPVRNRIISGMAHGTVVVEAARKSGSLITARLAAEQNREVFAVPGSVQSFKSIGAHTLIKQGAKLVENVQDILEELPHLGGDSRRVPAPHTAGGKPPAHLAGAEAEVYAALEHYPTHIDDLSCRLNMDPGKLASTLLLLELKGLVRQSPGKIFCLVDD